MNSNSKLNTRMGLACAACAAAGALLLYAVFYRHSLLSNPNTIDTTALFIPLAACVGYLAGSLLGYRFEQETRALNQEIDEQLNTTQALLKTNEYLESQSTGLKKNSKALLSIMEDAERFNQELKKEIAERKSAQAEAVRAKESMELILDGGDLAYWDWDIQRETYSFNRRFSAMLGLPADDIEALNRWRKERIYPDDVQRMKLQMENHLNEKTETFSCEYRLKGAFGNWVWVLDRGKVVEWNEDRSPMRMVGTLLDINTRKEYELEMKEANRRLDRQTRDLVENQHIVIGMMEDANEARENLERANRQLSVARERAEQATKAKSDFLASMSHEIRTPMNGIIGTASLMNDTELSTEQKEYLRIIQTSGDTLLTLLNDILDFSRIEAGKMTLEPYPFNLRETCEHIIELFAPTAHSKNIDLVLHFSSDTCPWVVGDAGRIRQILTNLISNAVKFTREGHVFVDVSTAAGTNQESTIHFNVNDTGIGISKEKRTKLFQKFSQADSSSTREFGGSGLGLAICKELVDLMKGKIGMESEPDKGSCFWFRLNLPTAEAPVNTLIDRTVFQGEKVLVVDDKMLMGRMLTDWLNRWGLQTTTVSPLKESVDQLKIEHYQIIFIEERLAKKEALSIFDEPGYGFPLRFVISSIRKQITGINQSPNPYIHLFKPVGLNRLFEEIARALNYSSELTQPPTAAIAGIPAANLEEIACRRILLAEDNMINQTVAKRMLMKAGFEVDVAEDGKQAYEKIVSGITYDLVLMDCQMPKMDGYEASRQIREYEKKSDGVVRVPIVALTANAMHGDREKCMDAGMDDHLPKPVKRDALYEMLQRHLC